MSYILIRLSSDPHSVLNDSRLSLFGIVWSIPAIPLEEDAKIQTAELIAQAAGRAAKVPPLHNNNDSLLCVENWAIQLEV